MAALLMMYSSQWREHWWNTLINSASNLKQKWPTKEDKCVNSDLSCHELSKTRWEGQSGDDQRYNSREDKPARGEKNMKML